MNSRFYTTDANFSATGGSFEKLGGGRNYQNFHMDLGSQYAISPRFSLLGSARLAYAKSTDGSYDRKNSQLSELHFASQYRFMVKPLVLIPEARLVVPLNPVDANTDEVLTGEGALAAEVGFWAAKTLWGVGTYLYAGYRYRNEGRAGLVPYQAGVLRSFGGLTIGGELHGYLSVAEDTYTNTPSERLSVVNRVNAGSRRYNSINPDLLEYKVWAGYRFGRSAMAKLGFGSAINGANSAVGHTVYLTVNWTAKLPQSKRSKKGRLQIEQFDIESESYDEDLFREDD